MQLTSLDQITNQYRHIYLSPHFDDAVLSCGGTIALQTATGQKVLLLTVFGGVPAAGTQISGFASQLQQATGLGLDPAEATRRRRVEDTAAANVLHADTLWLDYLEAIYRGTPPQYASEDSIFGAVHSADLPLDEELAGVLLNIHERAPLAVIYAPLGIGHHVDHQLLCSAADRLAQRRLNVKFYEDFPYVSQPGALEGRQRELGIPMEPQFVEVSGTVRYKEEAVAQYASQVPRLFGTQENMLKVLGAYGASLRRTYPGIQLERFWRWQ